MELEKQVCSLELAKRLKALGVKQESLFFWSKTKIIPKKDFEYQLKINVKENYYGWATPIGNTEIVGKNNNSYSAFSVAELGEKLKEYQSRFQLNFPNPFLTKEHKHFEEFKLSEINNLFDIYDKNLANCLAKMLIYLIENKLVPAIKS